MTLQIQIENQQKKIPLSPTVLAGAVQKILRHEGIARAAVSVVFVTDQKIRTFNKKYLGRDYTTDVLAFDLKENISAKVPCLLTGDIIISVTTAVRNAKVYQTTPWEEIILYISHGILHLLGYDDHSAKDIKRMRAKERELMAVLKPFLKKSRTYDLKKRSDRP